MTYLIKILSIVFLLKSSIGNTQKRIAVDINYRQNTLNTSFNYHKVFKKKFIWSVGFNLGGKGKVFIEGPYYGVEINPNMYLTSSPFPEIASIDTFKGQKNYLDKLTINSNIGAVNFSLGYFHNFTINHGVRAHITGIFGYSWHSITSTYVNSDYLINMRTSVVNHFSAGAGAELYHTIRLVKNSPFITV